METGRSLSAASTATTLGSLLDLGAVSAEGLYGALDLLHRCQPLIERAQGRRRLQDGALVLTAYDV